MNTEKHTALPWELYKSEEFYGIDGGKSMGTTIVTFGSMNEDIEGVRGKTIEEGRSNAELIVRAVNNHHKLVEACTEALLQLKVLKSTHTRDIKTNGLTPNEKEQLSNSLWDTTKAIENLESALQSAKEETKQ
jgi:hypothetical protein